MKRSKEGTQLDVYSEGDLGYLTQLFFQLIYKRSTSGNLVMSSEPVIVQDSQKLKSEALDPSDVTIVPASTSDQKAENSKQDEQSEDQIELER